MKVVILPWTVATETCRHSRCPSQQKWKGHVWACAQWTMVEQLDDDALRFGLKLLNSTKNFNGLTALGTFH